MSNYSGAGIESAGIGAAGIGAGPATPELATFRIGAATYPLPAAVTNPTVSDADPALAATLAYLQWALGFYMGARWTAECTAMGRTDIAASPVAYAINFEPTEYLQQEQVKLPVLALYRTKVTDYDISVQLYRVVGEWTLNWIMPPLTSGQMQRLWPFTHAAMHILTHALYQGHDPGYASNALVLLNAGIDEVAVMGAEYGKAVMMGASTTLVFPGVSMRLQVGELVGSVPGAFSPVAGVDTELDLQTSTTTVAPFVQVQS